MLPSYEAPLRFQEVWFSLQTHSRPPRNPPRGLTLQMGMLGNLKARTALRMCSKNLQLAPNCGTWVSHCRALATHCSWLLREKSKTLPASGPSCADVATNIRFHRFPTKYGFRFKESDSAGKKELSSF